MQSDLDFDPHRIGDVGEPALVRILTNPSRSYDGENNVAICEGRIEMAPEIHADRDVVDVAEHRFTAEVRSQPIENPAGNVERVVTAIGDRDPRHGLRCSMPLVGGVIVIWSG